MNDLKVYVSTSDNYLHVLKPFSYLFNKFWSPEQKVTVVGFKEPDFSLPSNFDFISLGKQRGIQYWSDDYIEFLNLVEDDYFIHMVENEFLLRPVNFELIKTLSGHLNESVGRIDLTPGPSLRSWEPVETHDNYDVIQLTQEAQYRLAIRLNIWNKEYFLKNLHSGEDAWQFEINGLERAKNDGYKILATNRRYPCYIMDGTKAENPRLLDLRAKNPEISSFSLPLDEGTIKEMCESNIITERRKGFFSVC